MKNERERQLQGKLLKTKEELKLGREEVHVNVRVNDYLDDSYSCTVRLTFLFYCQ